MLSRKAKYGLKALLFLAQRVEEGPVLIEELATKERIPHRFLEQILLDLKRKGVLSSKKGRRGGYQLGRSPEEIFIGDVVRVLDGPLAPVPCVSVTAYRRCDECLDERGCGIRAVMQDVRDGIAEILDNTSISDMLRRMARQTKADRGKRGFSRSRREPAARRPR